MMLIKIRLHQFSWAQTVEIHRNVLNIPSQFAFAFSLECSSYNVQIHGSVEIQTYFQEASTITTSVFSSANEMSVRRWLIYAC